MNCHEEESRRELLEAQATIARLQALVKTLATNATEQELQAEVARLREQIDELTMGYEARVDRPLYDGTDGAHPAWWRGQEAGARGMNERCARIAEAVAEDWEAKSDDGKIRAIAMGAREAAEAIRKMVDDPEAEFGWPKGTPPPEPEK